MGSTLTVDTIQGATTAANVKLPAGSVLQMQRTELRTYTQSNSATYASTGLAVTITPKFASSKILAHITLNGVYMTGTGQHIAFALYRASTNVATLSTTAAYRSANDEPSYGVYTNSYEHLDSPSTASATTYTLYWKLSGGQTGYINNYNVGNTSSLSSMTLMEISQ